MGGRLFGTKKYVDWECIDTSLYRKIATDVVNELGLPAVHVQCIYTCGICDALLDTREQTQFLVSRSVRS